MKAVIGLIENVKVIGVKETAIESAKFDTGAQTSSIDKKLAERLGIGAFLKSVKIKSASAGKGTYSYRPVHRLDIEIRNKVFHVNFNITDRSHMKQKVLIGRDVITGHFIIDVETRQGDVKNG
jgi:hypothetical protein